MKSQRRTLARCLGLAFLILGTGAGLGQTYVQQSFMLGCGGGVSSNNDYTVQSALGQPAVGKASSQGYAAASGFWTSIPTVSSLDASGPGSLQDVISGAAPGDPIIFGVTGTIALAGVEVAIYRFG